MGGGRSMFSKIRKQVALRTRPVKRFAALHSARTAGIAAGVLAGAALAVVGLRRRNHVRDSVSGELTWNELYEQARKREIPGRSSMTKEELKQALAAY
jgi:tetrahydromethanopterin S-methyltransferase subunit F